jgi:CHAT domain
MANASVKKILLVVLGVGVFVWFLMQRNAATPSPAPAPGASQSAAGPRVRSSSSLSDDMSSGTAATNAASNAAPAQVPSPVPGAQDERVERYPLLDCPDTSAADVDFPIQVSLTEDQQTPQVKILGNGNVTPEGKLIMALPATQADSWKVEVVVSGTGLQFDNKSAFIDLPRHGDATFALFHAKPTPALPADGKVHVLVTYWYQARYLARIQRDVQITNGASAAAAEAPVIRRTVNPSGGVDDTGADSNDQVPQPDLTLYIKNDSITINSPYLDANSGPLKDSKGFAEWLQQNSWNLASAGRGSQGVSTAAQPNNERAEGFGELLYEKYAPDVFKSAFWALVDKRGKHFRTIQVYSDNPQIPWELMKPVRKGSAEQSFLGVDYSIARWHVTDDGIQRDRPPGTETVQKMVVIAPHYTGARTLDAEASEIQGLAQLNGYSAVNGNMNALRVLFHDPPQGIVHFAGHGELSPTDGDFAILLEDGELDTTTWRGMVKSDPSKHPFFFFNACDVGQAKHTGNFVDGWAPAVLDAGASGYIGALFPVNDQVAAKFSVLFYQLLQQQMQAGPADVSEILERTRRQIYQSTGNPTALAYVLYGDTNLRFKTVAAR